MSTLVYLNLQKGLKGVCVTTLGRGEVRVFCVLAHRPITRGGWAAQKTRWSPHKNIFNYYILSRVTLAPDPPTRRRDGSEVREGPTPLSLAG